MVNVVFSPIKELIIHEIVNVDFGDLIRERVTPSGNMPLYWCDGILFSFSSIPVSEDTIKEYIEGRVHWAEVHYVEMGEYMPIVTLEDSQYQGSLNVRVIDTSKSNLHKAFVKWLNGNKNIMG
ncbi:MAG: hypothetical protein QXN59_00260 [Candidatus Micrarchaeaceae archaeon]